MKKFAIYAFALLATAFTSCTEDFENWAEPQGFEQEEAVGVSFSATAGASIDFATYEGETVTVFTPSVTMPEGAEVAEYRLTVSGNELAVDLNGNVNTEEYEKLVIALNGRRPTERTMPATVDAFIAFGEQTLKASADIELKATPEAPVIESEYYFIGTTNGWGERDKSLKFNHSGNDVYDDPVFTITVAAPYENGERVDNWFKIAPLSAYAEDVNFWDSLLGSDTADGDDRAEAGMAVKGGSFVQYASDGAKYYKISINMLDYIMTVTPLNFQEYIYAPGDPKWNPQTAPAVWSQNLDGVYTGYAYLTTNGFKFVMDRATQDWNPQYNASTFTTKSEGITGDDNICAPANGFYHIDADIPNASLTLTETKWVIIGAVTGDSNWGTTFEMTYDADSEAWVYTGELVTGEFKFRGDDAWKYNVGGSFDNLVQDGGNLSITEAGTYEIKLYLTRSTSDNMYCTVTKK